jgi:hypothetical protein
MGWIPISRTVPQYSASATALASGYYLKAYKANTVTPLSMATDDTGSTTLAKTKINTTGNPLSNPADDTSVFIPHFSEPYKLAFYTNETDADNDTIASAVWVVDDIANDLRMSVIERTGSWTIASTDVDAQYNVVTGAGGYNVTVPAESNDTMLQGFAIHIRNNATSNITIVEDGVVTVNPPNLGTLVVPPSGTVSLVYSKINTDEWDLSGQVVLA